MTNNPLCPPCAFGGGSALLQPRPAWAQRGSSRRPRARCLVALASGPPGVFTKQKTARLTYFRGGWGCPLSQPRPPAPLHTPLPSPPRPSEQPQGTCGISHWCTVFALSVPEPSEAKGLLSGVKAVGGAARWRDVGRLTFLSDRVRAGLMGNEAGRGEARSRQGGVITAVLQSGGGCRTRYAALIGPAETAPAGGKMAAEINAKQMALAKAGAWMRYSQTNSPGRNMLIIFFGTIIIKMKERERKNAKHKPTCSAGFWTVTLLRRPVGYF